jgi:thiol-disulfide isomerase/thioredoxin
MRWSGCDQCCSNCKNTQPYLNAWHEKHEDDGLLIIGVHKPEFEFEKDPTNVERAVEKANIRYPVVLDNNYATWNAYEQHYWSAWYLIDAYGFIRYQHFGEGADDDPTYSFFNYPFGTWLVIFTRSTLSLPPCYGQECSPSVLLFL